MHCWRSQVCIHKTHVGITGLGEQVGRAGREPFRILVRLHTSEHHRTNRGSGKKSPKYHPAEFGTHHWSKRGGRASNVQRPFLYRPECFPLPSGGGDPTVVLQKNGRPDAL